MDTHPDQEEILSADIKASARKRMEGLLMAAVDAIEETIENGVGGVRLSAATKVLDFNFVKGEKDKDDFLEKLYGDIQKPK